MQIQWSYRDTYWYKVYDCMKGKGYSIDWKNILQITIHCGATVICIAVAIGAGAVTAGTVAAALAGPCAGVGSGCAFAIADAIKDAINFDYNQFWADLVDCHNKAKGEGRS